MLTVSRPQSVSTSIPEGFACYPCALCGVAMVVDDHAPETPMCRSCQRVGAESAVAEAARVLDELRTGTGVMSILSPTERAEQISQLLGDVSAPTLVRASLKQMSDNALIRIIAETSDVVLMGAASVELSKRLPVSFDAPAYSTPTEPPSPEERDELESRIELTFEPDTDFMDGERFDGLA